MKNTYHFERANLDIEQYKTITCNVQIEIATLEDDEFSDSVDDPSEYIDGVRAIGELHFDDPPFDWKDKRKSACRKGVVGMLVLSDSEDSTKLPILLVENTAKVIIDKNNHRYFWQFFCVGKPLWDKLELFPSNYRGKKAVRNRVYLCTDFRGYWPKEVASIVIALNSKHAKELLDEELKKHNIPSSFNYTLKELDLLQSQVMILKDGD